MPMPTDHALRQAEMLAMRQIADNLAATNRNMEKLGDRLQAIGDDVSALKAQDTARAIEKLDARLTATLSENRLECERHVNQVEAELTAKINALGDRVTAKTEQATDDRKLIWVQIEQIKGRIIPVIVGGGLVVSGAVAFLVERVLK